MPQGADGRAISVRLVLAGGHCFSLALSSEHPLLHRLLATIAAAPRSKDGSTTCFQIPIEGGRGSLAFAAERLVAVTTDPSMPLQADLSARPSVAMPASPAIAAALAASMARGHSDLIRHSVVQLDGFLKDAEVAWLMTLTLTAEHRFVPARLTSHRDDYRQALMMSAPHELWEFMTARIKSILPDVLEGLHIRPFRLGNIDCQITASVDGSYFKAHTDAAADGPVKRQLSYVYYFNCEPKGFSGGELRIYDDTLSNGKLSASDSFQTIEPRHNSIVFFQSAIMHEVMPVRMPSRQFRDARFTVNGWVDRA